MNHHRNAQSRVPKNAQLDNFDPADAFESLYTELVELEVCAHSAGEVVTRLTPPASRPQRRECIRFYALVSKVTNDLIAAVRHGDELVGAAVWPP
jgi:hypothetical protein